MSANMITAIGAQLASTGGLIVIDPESATDEQLAPLLAMGTVENVRAVLRSLVARKPEEPMGFAAVVEDIDGKRWIRAGMDESGGPWFWGPPPRGCGWERREYADIAAVDVLQECVL